MTFTEILSTDFFPRSSNLLFPIRVLFLNFWTHTTAPTDLFTSLEPQNQEIDKLYVVKKHGMTDIGAPMLWKGRSGYAH